MKMLVLERRFQRDLVEPCKPTNNFSRDRKGLSPKKWQPQKILKICFIAYCAILHSVLYSTKVCDIAHYANKQIFISFSLLIRTNKYEDLF